MKFSAKKALLYEAMSNASDACALKPTLNVPKGVLLNLEGNALIITGYDLEMSIKISMLVDGQQDGKVVTDPKLLAQMLEKVPGDIVSLTFNDNRYIEITSSKSKSKSNISSGAGSEFPNIIEIKNDKPFEISEKLLKNMLTGVRFAVGRTAPVTQNITIEIKDNVFYAVATDGHRLAVKYCTIKNDNIIFVIPEKAVSALLKVLSDEDGEKSNPKKISISADRNRICISKENYVLISQFWYDRTVSYRWFIDGDFPLVLTVNAKELALSMERCIILHGDRFRHTITCSVNGDFMKIICESPLGTEDGKIPITVKAGDFANFSIKFDPCIMLEALQNTYCEEIKISFAHSLSPFKITPLEDNGEFIFIMVPCK